MAPLKSYVAHARLLRTSERIVMFRSLFVLVLIASNFLSEIACGQLSEAVKAKQIEEADGMAVDLVAMQDALPEQWVALQRRSTIDSGQIDDLKMSRNWIEEFRAHSSNPKVDITRFSVSSKKFDSGIEIRDVPMVVQTYAKSNLIHFKRQDEAWQIVPVVPKFGYTSSYPFSWCLGLQSSERSGSLDDSYLARMFWVGKRECLYTRDSKQGLVSFWGQRDKNSPPYMVSVEFDKYSKLPVSYALLHFPNGVTDKAIAEGSFKVTERGETEWKEYSYPQGNETLKIKLPIRVRTLSLQFENSELECINELYWILGDNVPASAFNDPLKNGIAKPPFPEIEEREKLRVEQGRAKK